MDNAVFFIIIIGLIAVMAFSFSGSFSSFSSGSGPIATGPGSATDIRNPQPVGGGKSIFNVFRFTPPPPSASKTPSPTIKEQLKTPKPGYSPYEGMVRISTVDRSSTDPKKEYVTLRNGGYFGIGSSNAPIAVTGWTIENVKHDKLPIPKAYNIPLIDADMEEILLPPSGQIHIVTGRQDMGVNFRENACIGYLSQNYQFIPSLPGSCIDHVSQTQIRSKFLDLGYSGACIDYVSSLASCRIPVLSYDTSSKIGNACIEYITKNIHYSGCVKNYRDDKTFLKNVWRVYLNRSQKLFDPKHDRVILRDDLGLIVDQFEY